MNCDPPLTVAEVRSRLEGLPDQAEVYVSAGGEVGPAMEVDCRPVPPATEGDGEFLVFVNGRVERFDPAWESQERERPARPRA